MKQKFCWKLQGFSGEWKFGKLELIVMNPFIRNNDHYHPCDDAALHHQIVQIRLSNEVSIPPVSWCSWQWAILRSSRDWWIARRQNDTGEKSTKVPKLWQDSFSWLLKSSWESSEFKRKKFLWQSGLVKGESWQVFVDFPPVLFQCSHHIRFSFGRFIQNSSRMNKAYISFDSLYVCPLTASG